MRGGKLGRILTGSPLPPWILSPPGAGARDGDEDRARAALEAGDIRPLSEILDAAGREFPDQVLEVELEHGA